MKRVFSLACTVLLLVSLCIGGLFAVRKAFSMYKNIWDMLDTLANTMQDNASEIHKITERICTLDSHLYTLSTQVDHLHRETFRSDDSITTGYDYSWLNSVPPYIAHACGGIDGVTYTNSREAFIQGYNLGQRVFEIDFNLSNDGVLIASHDENTWRQLTGSNLPYTSEHFNQLLLLDEYDSLSCADVIDLMALYPDVYVVTDTKSSTQSEVMLAFSQLVHCAKKSHPEVLNRIVPQIYNEQMLSWISSIYPFRSVIFTLYQLHWTPEAILNFCMNSGIRFITIPADQVSEDVLQLWDTLGIHIGVHTINDQDEAEKLFNLGIDMLYTDFISPN